MQVIGTGHSAVWSICVLAFHYIFNSIGLMPSSDKQWELKAQYKQHTDPFIKTKTFMQPFFQRKELNFQRMSSYEKDKKEYLLLIIDICSLETITTIITG